MQTIRLQPARRDRACNCNQLARKQAARMQTIRTQRTHTGSQPAAPAPATATRLQTQRETQAARGGA